MVHTEHKLVHRTASSVSYEIPNVEELLKASVLLYSMPVKVIDPMSYIYLVEAEQILPRELFEV